MMKRVLATATAGVLLMTGWVVTAGSASASAFGTNFSYPASSSFNGLDGVYGDFPLNGSYTSFLDNGVYHFRLQSDGNAVVYHGTANTWSTRTSGNSGAHFTFQNDGNIVVRSSSGAALWASGTGIRRDNTCYQLLMQTDGNLVWSRTNYDPAHVTCSGTRVVLWASGTAGT